MEQLRAAVRYGADAVYLATDRFGMRARAANFALADVPAAVAHGARGGRDASTWPRTSLMERRRRGGAARLFPRHSEAAGVDAWSSSATWGRPAMARAPWLPRVALHVSNAGVAWRTPRRRACGTAWARGRVVCAREMSPGGYRPPARGRARRPGAARRSRTAPMCMAVSGRCLISSYLTGRSGNQWCTARSRAGGATRSRRRSARASTSRWRRTGAARSS